MLRGCVSAASVLMGWGHPGTWDGEVIMNEEGLLLPYLAGYWATEGGKQIVLQLYQLPMLPAVAPNSTYALRTDMSSKVSATCTLSSKVDYDTRRRLPTHVKCDSSGVSFGARGPGLVSDDNHTITWADGTNWARQPNHLSDPRFSSIHTVHVIFMNHYDVGYTDFINGVDNTYIHKYYPGAEQTAEKYRQKTSEAFTYTTHPWLMERFVNCPCKGAHCLATDLNNTFEPPLQCPTDDEIADFTAAAQRRDIVWNGAPFNIQPENMSPELFRAGFDLVRRMDERFGTPLTRTMSIRDVIYVTRNILPYLRDAGITGLTIGSNGADYPPQVPKLHRWVDKTSGTDIVVAYHPYGYGGFGLKDCAESPNGVALCSEFRTDNTGPPTLDEVMQTLGTIRQEYPGATVKPSTFDNFFADVLPVRDQLPIVELEVGDTWTYGNPSDPLKIAQHRAIQRAWIQCLRSGETRCTTSDLAIQNMTFFLMKAPEHTWGTPGISGWGQGGDYNTTSFHQHITNTTYMKAAASWMEQRLFNELAVRALEEAHHPLAARVRREVDIVESVDAPDLSGYREVALDTKVDLAGGFRVGFATDGSISTLRAGGVAWASPSATLAGFVYHTFNDTEWAPFTYSYLNDHAMQTGFCKPGSNPFSESKLWRPTIRRLSVSSDGSSAVAEMDMPEKASVAYGAFKKLFLKVSASASGLNLELRALGKTPTMIGEAAMLTFQPAPTLKPGIARSAWTVDKLGATIDPEGVLKGGNQFVHGVWNGATVSTEDGSMTINSIDASNFNPITDKFPVGNPLPASYLEADAKAGTGMDQLAAGSVRGMAVSLHNNLWNTNYPLFYPYFDARLCSTPLDCRNRNALFRFRLSFIPQVDIYV